MKTIFSMTLENKEGLFVKATGIRRECLAKKYKYEFELKTSIIGFGEPNNRYEKFRTNSITDGNEWLLKIASEV